jgi:tetratricopeptide (TPR) repeat protein
LQQAAEIASRRYAHRQADETLTRALELAGHLPQAERMQTELQLLSILAAHRWAGWDMHAIEASETLAARAARYGLIDAQVRALLDLSFILSFTSAERCLEASQRALQLSAEQDSAMRTRTRGVCAFRRLSVSGWNPQDVLEFRAGLAELGERHGLPALDSDLVEDSLIRWLSGEYREARRLALDFRAKGREPGAAPNLKFEYDRTRDLVSVYLIFLGEWGQALKEIASAMAEAQNNANKHNILWLRVHQAWLHLHALDFRGALKICDSVLVLLRDPGPRAAPLGQLRRALICSGSASAALGDYARALEDFSTVARAIDHQTVFLDWYWRMPLAAGLTELWLAKDDGVRARVEAERFLALSLVTAERTWQGIAWETNARVALANRDYARAHQCIGKAISTVQGFEVPLAIWQIHATAAHIEEVLGNPKLALSHEDVSRATILQLANSLPEQEPLREIFLSAPAVVRVLDKDSRRA